MLIVLVISNGLNQHQNSTVSLRTVFFFFFGRDAETHNETLGIAHGILWKNGQKDFKIQRVRGHQKSKIK